VADNEPPDEITASTTQPLPWPDPSRPIVNQQPGGAQGYGSGFPEPWMRQGPEAFDPSSARRSRWPVVVALLVILVAVLVVVWLLWWR
jgi:hypothetical protein